MKIRQLKTEDMTLLIALRMEVLSDVFSEEKKGLSKEEWKQLQENNLAYYRQHLTDNSHIACVAEENGEVLGCGGVCLYQEMPSPDNRSGKCAYLMNIYTRPSWRRKGIARDVVEWLIARSRLLGAEKIYLETSDDGRRLYENLGFSDMKGYMKL